MSEFDYISPDEYYDSDDLSLDTEGPEGGMAVTDDSYYDDGYRPEPAEKKKLEQVQRTPSAEYSTPKTDLQKDLEEYSDSFHATLNKFVPEGVNSMAVQSLSDTTNFLSQRIPELVGLVEKAKEGDPNAIAQLLAANPMSGTLFAGAQEVMDTLAKEDPVYRKRLEAFSGDKYYTENEIKALPPEEQDRIRSKQGNFNEKISHSLSNFWNGLVAVGQNAYDNFSKADSVGDYIASYADYNASLSAIGMAPMVARIGLDYADTIRTDPVGTVATVYGAAKFPGRVRAALGKAPVTGAVQKLRDAEAAKSPAEALESFAVRLREKDSPALNAVGESILELQRGVGPSVLDNAPITQKVAGAATGIASASLPYILSKDSLMGASPEVKSRIKQADRSVRGRQGKLADDIMKITEESPLAFGILREFGTANQKLMPEIYEVISNVEKLYKKYADVDAKLKSKIENKVLNKESVAELGVKLRENERVQSQLNAAISKLDLTEIDRIREANMSTLFDPKKMDFDNLKNPEAWKSAARKAIDDQPESFMSVTYEGKPVHPLMFILEGINKSRPMKDFDVNKLGMKVKIDKNASPEAAEFLISHNNAVVDIMRMAAEQAKDLADIRRPDGTPLITERTLLANTLAGYFPEGKIAKAFGETKDMKGSAGKARIDDALSITENHLKLAVEKRKSKPPKTLEEAVEYVKEDADAIRLYQNVLSSNMYTIEKAKAWTDLYTMLEESGKIFNEKPNRAGYVKAVGEGIEFGPMKDKYIPKVVHENITRYDREWGVWLKGLRQAQQVFKTSKTVMNAPYFYNTGLGLAFTQILYGGKPIDVILGMKDYASKNKYYMAMRDAGFLMDADQLVGLESGNKSLIKKLGTAYKGKTNSEQYGGFVKSLESLIEDFDNPLQVKQTKKKKLLRDAGLVAVLGGTGGVLAGPAGAALGTAQALILPRGRYLSTLLDQGSRVASFKRYINTEAASIARKQKIPKNKAIDLALKDPETVNRAAEFALYTNIDYSYVPMGVEKMSALLPATPFIKFAHRALGAMLAYPGKEPVKFVAISDAHRKHMENMDEQKKMQYTFAPVNTSNMLIDLNNDSYLNISYTVATTPQVASEATAVPTKLFGGTGPIMYGGQALDKAGKTGASMMDLFSTGYTEAIIDTINSKDRFGRDLVTYGDHAKNMLTSVSPSSVHWMREMIEASQSPNQKNSRGFTVEQIFMNSFGLKVTPKSEIHRKLKNISSSYRRNLAKAYREYSGSVQYAKNKGEIERAKEKYEKRLEALSEKYRDLTDGNTLNFLRRTGG